jgi:hypothetical protein
MKPLFRTLLVALGISLLALPLGCADGSTALAPDPAAGDAVFSASQGGPAYDVLAQFKQRPAITIAWARKWIGPEGGRLDFQGFAIEVPPGAVDRVTQFSIRLPVDPSGSERVVAQFGPHNARFKVPVAIELPFRNTSLEDDGTPTVVWWNDGWVDMGAGVTADGNRLRTTTDHFSTYGTAERGGVVTTSGG